MKTLTKVWPCVLRYQAGWQVLAFTHPLAGRQLVKGTLETGESLEKGAFRELLEESGLQDVEMVQHVQTLTKQVSGGPQGLGPMETQFWEVFALRLTQPTPESWQHQASGSPEEEGLVFDFFWQVLQGPYVGFHPLFLEVLFSLEQTTHFLDPKNWER